MTAKTSRALRVAGAIAALAILAWLFRGVDLARAVGLATQMGPIVLLGLVPWGLAMALDSLAWGRLFRGLDRRPRYLDLLHVRVATEAVLVSVLAGGVVSEGLTPLLLRRRGIPIDESAATALARKNLLVLSQSVYVAIGAIAGAGFLVGLPIAGEARGWLPFAMLAVAAGLGTAGLAIALLLGAGQVAARLHRGLVRLPFLSRWLGDLSAGFSSVDRLTGQLYGPRRREVMVAGAIFTVSWLAEALETWLLLRLLGVELGLGAVLAFEPLLALLRHATLFVPAGLGVQDAGYAFVLGAAGVPDPLTTAAGFSLLKRGKELVWIAIGYGLLGLAGRGAPTQDLRA